MSGWVSCFFLRAAVIIEMFAEKSGKSWRSWDIGKRMMLTFSFIMTSVGLKKCWLRTWGKDLILKNYQQKWLEGMMEVKVVGPYWTTSGGGLKNHSNCWWKTNHPDFVSKWSMIPFVIQKPHRGQTIHLYPDHACNGLVKNGCIFNSIPLKLPWFQTTFIFLRVLVLPFLA